jgi:hypothetical protein
MPDLDQIKQGEQGERDRRGRFARGRSGNPAGRPRGCRDHVNRAARLRRPARRVIGVRALGPEVGFNFYEGFCCRFAADGEM